MHSPAIHKLVDTLTHPSTHTHTRARARAHTLAPAATSSLNPPSQSIPGKDFLKFEDQLQKLRFPGDRWLTGRCLPLLQPIHNIILVTLPITYCFCCNLWCLYAIVLVLWWWVFLYLILLFIFVAIFCVIWRSFRVLILLIHLPFK